MNRNLFGMILGLAVLLVSLGCEIPDAAASPKQARRSPVSTNITAPSLPTPSATQTPPESILTPTPVPDPALVVTPGATIPASPPTATLQTITKPGPAPNEVWVVNIEYRPNIIVVPLGTTVTWISKDGEGHDVMSDDDLFNFQMVQGQSFDFTFSERGTFFYHCGCAMMEGVVIVE